MAESSDKEKRTCDANARDGPEKEKLNVAETCGSSKRLDFTPSEGGWGWMVCFASFWSNGTIFGTLNTFGIIYVELIKSFEDSQDGNLAFKLSWIGALQICMIFMMSSFASVLVDRFGIRPTACVGSVIASVGMLLSSFVRSIPLLYLTYGVLLGFGSSLIYNPSLVILGHYFHKRLGVVNGVVSFGSAVFTMVMPYGLQYLVSTIGLPVTLRIMAAAFTLLIPLTLTWKPTFQQKHSELDCFLSTESMYKRAKGIYQFLVRFLNVSIWKNRQYMVWAIALPIALFGYFVPFVHLVNHTRIVFPANNGGILVTCIGVTSGVSRLVFGKISDCRGVNRMRLQQVALVFQGLLTASIPFIPHFWMLIAVASLMGVFDGCFICLLGPIAFDLLGPQGAAQGLGCLLSLASLPMTAGPPLAGLVFDLTQSYNIAFWVGGVPPLIGALLLCFIKANNQTNKSRSMTGNIVSMSTEDLSNTDATLAWSQDLVVRSEPCLHQQSRAIYCPPREKPLLTPDIV